MLTDLLVSRSVRLLFGLLVANLLLSPIFLLSLPSKVIFLKPLAAIISIIFFRILGYNLVEVHGRILLQFFNPASTEALLVGDGVLTSARTKVIDTSVIIDGQLRGELIGCGLLEGQFIVSQFMIDELNQLFDSSNGEKKEKGCRSFKLLKDLREVSGRRLVLNNKRYQGTN